MKYRNKNYAKPYDPYAVKTKVERIASHTWYRGRWEKDICSCGKDMLIPAGKSGQYRCNACAAGCSYEDSCCGDY